MPIGKFQIGLRSKRTSSRLYLCRKFRTRKHQILKFRSIKFRIIKFISIEFISIGFRSIGFSRAGVRVDSTPEEQDMEGAAVLGGAKVESQAVPFLLVTPPSRKKTSEGSDGGASVFAQGRVHPPRRDLDVGGGGGVFIRSSTACSTSVRDFPILL